MGSMGHITTLPRNSNTKLLITTAAKELASAKATLAVLRAEMNRLAQQLPEYETVRAMYGVGETTAVQLMAEIGDVRRFPRRSSIVSFAGVDPAVDDSGKHISLIWTRPQKMDGVADNKSRQGLRKFLAASTIYTANCFNSQVKILDI